MSRIIFSIDDENCRLLPLYITGAAINYPQEACRRKTGLPDYQLTICVKGEGCFKCGDKVHDIYPGTVFFYAPGVAVQYYPTNRSFTDHWVTFNGSSAENLFAYLEMGAYWVLYGCSPLVKALFEQCHTALENNHYYSCSMLLYRLLHELHALRKPSRQPAEKAGKMDLQAVLNQIEVDYDHDISLSTLARNAGVSDSYLCRVFKAKMHMTPIEYVNKIRVQKAKEYLAGNPGLSVSDVAMQVGFHDVSYFCHVFKRLEKTTPTLFRLPYLPDKCLHSDTAE